MATVRDGKFVRQVSLFVPVELHSQIREISRQRSQSERVTYSQILQEGIAAVTAAQKSAEA